MSFELKHREASMDETRLLDSSSKFFDRIEDDISPHIIINSEFKPSVEHWINANREKSPAFLMEGLKHDMGET